MVCPALWVFVACICSGRTGAELRVNTYQANWQRAPDILAMADGGFLVVWESYFDNFDDGPVTT
ncbi:MAG: hypothetical protein FJX28_15190 [Alphaproteobacteria bacterium]|nr:hypothetical protein [Alphaproteobacteria bacterium]